MPPERSAPGPEIAHALRTILLVEDEAVLRTLMGEELRDMGYRVTEAEHGIAALAAARAHPPDLVLCDLAMPVMSGLEFLQAYALEPDDIRAPVVILSAYGTQEQIETALAAGAKGYLRKPVDFRALGEILESTIKYRE